MSWSCGCCGDAVVLERALLIPLPGCVNRGVRRLPRRKCEQCGRVCCAGGVGDPHCVCPMVTQTAIASGAAAAGACQRSKPLWRRLYHPHAHLCVCGRVILCLQKAAAAEMASALAGVRAQLAVRSSDCIDGCDVPHHLWCACDCSQKQEAETASAKAEVALAEVHRVVQCCLCVLARRF
jgi:hypothetical protein